MFILGIVTIFVAVFIVIIAIVTMLELIVGNDAGWNIEVDNLLLIGDGDCVQEKEKEKEKKEKEKEKKEQWK